MKYGIIELHDNYDFSTPIAPKEIVMCKDCRFKRIYDDGETHYYYCALEDRPNRQWSIDETDFCSWGENDREFVHRVLGEFEQTEREGE